MTNKFHDQLDSFEARVRAEQAESDQAEADKAKKCICLEYIGDNGDCPIHGKKSDEEIKAEYYSDYGPDYKERNDLYCIGMGC